MTEVEWLTSTDPVAMLKVVTSDSHGRIASDRKLHLFAVACCRQPEAWDQLTDPRSRAAVLVAERYADGLATRWDLVRAFESVCLPGSPAISSAEWDAKATCSTSPKDAVGEIIRPPYSCSPATQAALLRDLFGNPWRPVQAGPWLTRTVQMVASVIYCDRRWEDLPILADAMEEAGCTDETIRRHCAESLHARGCWVLDLVLGKG